MGRNPYLPAATPYAIWKSGRNGYASVELAKHAPANGRVTDAFALTPYKKEEAMLRWKGRSAHVVPPVLKLVSRCWRLKWRRSPGERRGRGREQGRAEYITANAIDRR